LLLLLANLVKWRRGAIKWMLWPVIAPHEIIHYVIENGKMREMLLGDVSLMEFWQLFMKEPGFEKLSSLLAGQVLETVIPLRFHGDEGKWYNLKNIMIFSVGGIAHSNDPYLTRLLLTVLPGTKYVYEKRKITTANGKKRWFKYNCTFAAIAEFLAWSFEVAASGKWPDQPYVWGPSVSASGVGDKICF